MRRNGEWNDLLLYQFGLEATCLAEGLLRYDKLPNDPAKSVSAISSYRSIH